MQNNEGTKLALKLAGIYCLIKAIMYIPTVSFSFRMPGFTTTLVTFALLIILGLWLTFKNNPQVDSLGSTDFVPLGIAIAGIIILAIAISDLPLLISKFAYTATVLNPVELIGANSHLQNTMDLAGNLLQLLFGAILFYKSKYFAKLIK